MKLANTATTHHIWRPSLKRLHVTAKHSTCIVNTLAMWAIRHRTRKQLLRLTPLQRLDLGITLDQAKREAKKPFWL